MVKIATESRCIAEIGVSFHKNSELFKKQTETFRGNDGSV